MRSSLCCQLNEAWWYLPAYWHLLCCSNSHGPYALNCLEGAFSHRKILHKHESTAPHADVLTESKTESDNTNDKESFNAHRYCPIQRFNDTGLYTPHSA